MKSESISELTKALVKVQGNLKGALKDSNNPFFKSKYADLESVWESCRALLSENGLAVIQTTNVRENGAIVLSTLMTHVSGQWISGEYPLIPAKQSDPQAMVAAVTYARRATLAAIVGVVQVDDDGNLASGRQHVPQTQVRQTPSTQAQVQNIQAQRPPVQQAPGILQQSPLTNSQEWSSPPKNWPPK